MQPFSVILGIVLGSLVSITFSLAVVMLVFWILRDDDPRFAAEMPELVRGTLIFSSLAAAAALAFTGALLRRRWRFLALAVLGTGLFGTAYYYWPA
jgi:uncharacterized membrane protein